MRILVVEDEPRILAFVSRRLETDGYTVQAALDGAAALDAVAHARPDLVVLDLLLPRVDGLTVLKHLSAKHPTLPVVILSARDDLPTKLRGFELGAWDYLGKPFSLDELVARIRAHLRVAGESSRLLETGALTLDLARLQVLVGADAIDLSEREFQLLHHLVRHAGEVVSRDRLLAEVWGYSFDPGSNLVDVCIRRLRKKLGPHAPIETVRHAGYRLAA
jgi:two-component system, OmpR family, copper resistance phosphate regulon response regulator CusR